MKEPKHIPGIALLLVTIGCDFVALGDPKYVRQDPEIRDIVVFDPGPEYQELSDYDRSNRLEQNIRITKNYSLLAERLRRVIDCPRRTLQDDVPFTTNWLHLATWASRLAGEFIGDEDYRFMQWAVENWLKLKPDSLLTEMLGFLAQRRGDGVALGGRKEEMIVDSIKILLSAGNFMVAKEVQTATANFVDFFDDHCLTLSRDPSIREYLGEQFFQRYFHQVDGGADFFPNFDAAYEQIVENLPTFDEGMIYDYQADRMLALAFRLYFQVMSHPDMREDRRSQLMYLANVLVGAHEQHVLQTFIRGALSSFDIINPNIKAVFGATVLKLGVPFKPVGCELEVARRLDYVKFNRNVPWRPSPSLETFGIQEITYAFDKLGLTESLGDKAPDWTDFGARIGFIAAVYRALHENRFLTESPYVGWCGKDY